jgi:hypothetical protein
MTGRYCVYGIWRPFAPIDIIYSDRDATSEWRSELLLANRVANAANPNGIGA